MGLIITFGLVPLIGIGATLLYDHYLARIIEGDGSSNSSTDEQQDKILSQRMRRSTSSFFQDDMSLDDSRPGSQGAFLTNISTDEYKEKVKLEYTKQHQQQQSLDNPLNENDDNNDNGIPGGTTGGPWTTLGLEQPLVVAMVGLPARGKSYIVKMMIRFLNWTGFECQVFNVGKYRRKIGLQAADSKFFDTGNGDATKVREEMALAVQNEMYIWLHEITTKRRVAFFDATNTTIGRRNVLCRRAREESTFLLFVESICDDEEILKRNYELKLQNDDYKDMEIEKARDDFMKRVQMYEKVYETIEDHEDNGNLSYIKMINVGQKMITRNCSGYIPSQISFYLQNCHIHTRKIYLSLTSMNMNAASWQGGETGGSLTQSGKDYSQALNDFLEQDIKASADGEKDVLVLSGASRVHSETLVSLRQNFGCYATPLLNEMRGGDLHGFTREYIQKRFPKEFKSREKDKLNYRFPGVGGESYLDIIERVRPVIIELERQRRNVLIVCHIAVLRCIYAYMMGTKLEEIPYMQFKTHHVYELTPGAFGCECKVHDLSEVTQ
mgnify:CR=1 FL=1